MHYLSYSRRLSYLLDSIKKGQVKSPAQMAEKFKCSEKTIRRMINHLRDDGNDITYSTRTRKYVLNKSNLNGQKLSVS